MAASASVDTIKDRIRDIAIDAERNLPHLHDVILPSLGLETADAKRLLDIVRSLSEIPLGRGDQLKDDTLGRIYEYFLGRFAALEGRSGGEFYTPASIVRILTGILNPEVGILYDPCCGSGGMFVQAIGGLHDPQSVGAGRKRLEVVGQELNPGTRRLALLNLALHGIDADLGAMASDTFRDDQHPTLLADFILANPPFNQSDWGLEDLNQDPRWTFGLPPSSNANMAWVQHIVSHLNTRGKAGIVLANGATTSRNPSEASVRRSLVEQDLVECMISLPPKMFYSTTIPVTLWILSREKIKDPARAGRTLFIEGKDLGSPVSRSHVDLSDNEIERIINCYDRWVSGTPLDDPGQFAVVASTAQIAKGGYSLSPARYVATPTREDLGSGGTLQEAVGRFQQLAEQARELDEEILRAVARDLP